jgi:hypothetical protein
MTPEARATAHVALAQHNPYLEPPSIPPDYTLHEWSAMHPRRRSFLRRCWRRVHGH